VFSFLGWDLADFLFISSGRFRCGLSVRVVSAVSDFAGGPGFVSAGFFAFGRAVGFDLANNIA